ncbi:MAG: MtrB/PioB family decaheme-associated outer membrane protein [Deltaproteobacteria bacterium]|nr:MtrB/PioB family decaheme-associated outer membrane protein [Deltaproteobacteria bacterium]MCL4874595.1 MtrB/PioB family decaheme-associated outer membrane protein [bacterium]
MKRKLGLLVLALAALGWPAPSLAEDGLGGSLTFGGGFLDAKAESFKLGEYTGLSKDKAFLLAAADLSYGQGAYYLDFGASDLGLDNRRAYAEAGRLGAYRLFAEFSQTPKLISNNSKTIFTGEGTSRLTLPSGFTRGSQTTDFSNLDTYRRDVKLELERKSGRAGYHSYIGDYSEVSFSVEREHKDGLKYIGGTLGTTGGNTRSVGLPEPIDYVTDVVRVSAAHTRDTAQVQFDYYLSVFDNNKESIVWDNPFDVTNYPTTARTSLPPDNIHQRFSLSGGLDLPYNSRVSAVFEYGIMRQDEDLLPYSENSLSTVTVPVPRATAKAEIDTTHLALNLSSRPVQGLGVRAGYRYYKTDNKLSRTLFRYVRNDMAQAQEAEDSSRALYSLPYDYTQNQFKLDASYYLFKGTTARVGYARDVIERDYREVNKTKEDAYKLALGTTLVPYTTAGVDYLKAKRKASDAYDDWKIYSVYHTQEYIDTVSSTIRFDNLPESRKFDIADRERERIGANFAVSPTYNSAVSLFYSYGKDDFDKSLIGLRHSRTRSITVDGSLAPADIATVYAFYTREMTESRQNGRQYSSAAKATQFDDETRNWSAFHDENVDTFGVGARIDLLEKKASVNIDYTYSQSDTGITFFAGSGIATSTSPADLPELKTRLKTLSLNGKYRLSANVSVGAGYRYDNYKSDDWAVDNFEPASTTLPNVLTLVGPVSDYEAHTGMVFLTYSL